MRLKPFAELPAILLLGTALTLSAPGCSDDSSLPSAGEGNGGPSGGGGAAGAPSCDLGAPLGPAPLGAAGNPAALAALEHAVVALDDGWAFATDPSDQGLNLGYALPSFDDTTWATLSAGATWESQGYAGYDGVGWYRKRVPIPSDWSPGPIRLVFNGVDDEYDLYINGTAVVHWGVYPTDSVANRTTQADIDPYVVRGQDNLVALRVRDWGSDGGLWRNVVLRATVPLDDYAELLPAPVLDAEPELVALYWQAWKYAWDKVALGTVHNGLAQAYMDEGFNEQIYQWDSSFITLYARYGMRLFPVMPTLDNFYARQRPDGYIQRVYSETDGGELGEPTYDEPMVNPPLFAWVEWEYYRFSGDDSRLASVLPVLERYFAWLEANVRSSVAPELYRQTGLGSGMDNTPRGDVANGAWIDMSAEQALAARYLARIAGALGRTDSQAQWNAAHDSLGQAIDAQLWDDAAGSYFDLTSNGTLAGVEHIGVFWPLLAGVAQGDRIERLLAHLTNPDEFWRLHPFPSLSATDPSYSARGHYWQGGVWAPTNTMVVKGLEAAGYPDLAREAALADVRALAEVFGHPPSDEDEIAPEERDGDYATIWECYAPDAMSPGTRWDDTYFGRQDFVGWSGMAPIALLIEHVIGVQAIGAESRVVWTISRTDRHGVQRLPLGPTNVVSLLAAERAAASSPVELSIDAAQPFTLEVHLGAQSTSFELCAGHSELSLP